MKMILNGACGKMGKAVMKVVKEKYPEIDVIPVDIKKSEGIYLIDEVSSFDCIIDFSSPGGFVSALKHCLKYSKPLVSGTTGIGEEEKKIMKEASSKIAIFYSPNMSIGVNICFYLVDKISSFVKSDVYITDVHHRFKKDRPSGTAVKFKEIVESKGLKVDVASLRAGDVVGEHEICFVMEGERISISHRAFSRDIFATGAVEASLWLLKQKKGLYSFSDIFNF